MKRAPGSLPWRRLIIDCVYGFLRLLQVSCSLMRACSLHCYICVCGQRYTCARAHTHTHAHQQIKQASFVSPAFRRRSRGSCHPAFCSQPCASLFSRIRDVPQGLGLRPAPLSWDLASSASYSPAVSLMPHLCHGHRANTGSAAQGGRPQRVVACWSVQQSP